MLLLTHSEHSEGSSFAMLPCTPGTQSQEESLELVKVHLVLLIVGLGRVVLVQQVRRGLVGAPVVGRHELLLPATVIHTAKR